MTTESPASLTKIVGAMLALAMAFTLGFVVRSQLPMERESSDAVEAAALEVLRQAAERSASAAPEAVPVGVYQPAADDEAARPVIVRTVNPEYTDTALKARIQGVVILKTLIDDEGNVVDIEVLKGLPMGLNETAVDAVKQWKFEPATIGGQPVPMNHNVSVNFKLG